MSFVHVDAVASTYTDQRKGNPPPQPGVLANREESIDQVEKTPTTRWPSRSHEQMSFVRVDTLDVTSTPTSTKASRLANQEFSPTGRRASTTSRRGQRATTASPETRALAIAGLVSRTADDAMPASRADETDVYVRTIRPAIVGLIEMLGFHHREASVFAVRAVLLRLAHSVALPTDALARKRMGIDRSAFGRWMGQVRICADEDTLAGVVTNTCQKSHALKRRAEAATQPPPKRACTSGAGASNAPAPDASPTEAPAASASTSQRACDGADGEITFNHSNSK